MYEDQWRKSILLFLILFIHIILSSVNSWHSHCEERTTEICPRMLEPQMTPWSLWHQGRRSRTPATPPTSLVQRPPQMMFLWALLWPGRCVHRESRSTAPGWAEHIKQCGLKVDVMIRVLPTLLFNFLLSSHHTLITAYKMLQMLKKKKSPTTLKSASHLFEDLDTFYLYLHRGEGHWKKITVLQFFPYTNL